jgi:hypothetical protein
MKFKLNVLQQLLFVFSIATLFWLFRQMMLQRSLYFKNKKEEGFTERITIHNSIESKVLVETKIKASANSCYDNGDIIIGSEEDNKGLYKVMKEGCRFLDFEIYNVDGKGHVGFSSSSDCASIETSTVAVAQVLSKINNYSDAPNSRDPLFLQFRMKTVEMSIFNDLADYLKETFGIGNSGRLLDKKSSLNESTTIETTQNKVFVIIYTNNCNYSDDLFNNSRLYNLSASIFHIHNLSNDNFQNYYNIGINEFEFRIKMPGINNLYEEASNMSQSDNFNSNDSIHIHIHAFAYYIEDEYLTNYNEYFNQQMTAFVDTKKLK